MEVEDVEMSPVEMLDEEEVSTFTFDDACGPVRPSNEPEEKDYKSEGDPESRPATPKTPLTPDYLGLFFCLNIIETKIYECWKRSQLKTES